MMGMVLMKKLKWWMWVLLCVFLIFTLLIFTNSLPPPGYQTTDVSLYRVYPKRFDVKIVELAHRVFPAEIEEHFENVSYSVYYDPWFGGSEMWLEFTIQDPVLYLAHKAEVLSGNETTPFRYDDSFEAYTIEGALYKTTTSQGQVYVFYADFLQVLFCDESQTVVYSALSIKHTEYLPSDFVYFERFSIDVSELPSYYS